MAMSPTIDLPVADTLHCDTLSLMEWRSQDAFDYGRELVTPDFNVMQWVGGWLDELFGDMFDFSVDERYVRLLWIISGVVVGAVVAYLLYRYHQRLFGSAGKDRVSYPEEDTIYGIDFDAAIRRALDSNNYYEAVRMVYLQTLRYLSDNDYINWQIFKTPTQYINEVRSDTFRTFTFHFIRVRYGNYDADVSLFETMLDLQDTIRQQNPMKDESQKGGEQ